MHEEQIRRLETASDELIRSLEKIEQEIGELGGDLDREKQLRHLARLIYAGQLVEQVRLLYSLNEQSFCQFLSANKKSPTKAARVNNERKKNV